MRQTGRAVLCTVLTLVLALACGALTAEAAGRGPVVFRPDAASPFLVQDQLGAALTEAAQAGRAVLLPAGRIRIERTLWMPPRSNLRMAPGAVLTGAIPGQSLVRMTDGSRLSGGRIVNTATDDCFDVDFAPGTERASITGVRFGGAHADAVYIGAPDVTDVRIAGNRFTGVLYGVLLNPGAQRAARLRIVDNTFARIAGDAVEINAATPSARDLAREVVVARNVMRDFRGTGDGAGFGVGVAGARGFRITGNRIIGARTEAVHVEDRSSGGVIAGNVVRGGGVGHRPSVAIYRGVRDVVVVRNTINRFRGDGVAVLWDASGSSRDITIARNRIAHVQDSGIVIGGDAGTGPFTVRANAIVEPGAYGVVVLGTHARSSVTGNRIVRAGREAVGTWSAGDGVRRTADNGEATRLSAPAGAGG